MYISILNYLYIPTKFKKIKNYSCTESDNRKSNKLLIGTNIKLIYCR